MTSAVISLCPHEQVREDAGAINELYLRLGPASAERVLNRAVDELALGLGLISLAGVAADLRRCQGDATAFAAVCARLMRVAGSSLEERSGQSGMGA